MSKELKDIFISTFLILLSIFIYVLIIPNYVPDNLMAEMSPRFFPTLSIFMIGAFSSLLLTTSTYKLFTKNRTSTITKNKTICNLAPVLVVVILSFFIMLFQWLGFLIASYVTIVLLMMVFGQKKPMVMLLFSATITAGLFVLFNYGLNLPLL